MNGIVLRAQTFFLCLTLLSTGINVFASQYSDVVIADTPIAYWKLDQTTGDVAIDTVAGNNATLVGGPARNNPSGVPFDDGHSLLLNDGSTPHHIELPDTGLLDMQVFSYESWVKELPSSNCPPLYINLPLGAYSDARGIIIRLPFSTGCDSSTLEWGAGYGETERFYGGTNIDDDEWHHVVVTFAYMIDTPDTFRAIRIYVDGVMVAERLNNGAGISYENFTSGTPDDMVRIGVGADGFGGEINSYFSGYMDEIAFYDYVLTPEQVEEHFYAGTQPPPRVVSIEPLVINSGLADALLVSLNSYIQFDSFTVADFVMSGPDGDVIATSVVEADSSDPQVLVRFPPQITPGDYFFVIGPDILGKNGLAMDQDQDGIFGEPEEDSYSSSLTLGNPDPTRILSVTPTGLGNTPVASLSIHFELDVDPNSFTLDDIVLTGPGGAITPSSITTTNNLSFTVSFATLLSSDGLYDLSIGPNIATLFGGGMDQDQNGTPGETPDDIYTASFELDLTPPAPPGGLNYLLTPQINIVSVSPITLQGTRTEELSIWINGIESVTQGNGAWSLPLNLAEGTNDFILEAADRAGNRSDPVTLRFAYDTIAPVITGYTPPDGSYSNQASTTVSVTYNETGTGIDQTNSILSITRDGSPVAGNWIPEINSLRFVPDQPLMDGLYLVTNQLQDLAGHASNSLSHGFTLDTTAPAAPLVNELPAVIGNAQITVSGTKEADSEVLLNGQILVNRNALTDWSATVPLLNGPNTLTFTARDRAGNVSAPTVAEVTYDDTAPGPVTLSVSNPGDGVTLQLNWSSYDEAANGNDIASYAVYIEPSPYTTITALTPAATLTAAVKQYTAQGLTRNQAYYLAVVAIDTQNNRLDNVTPISVTTVDSTPPGNITGLRVIPTATTLQLSWHAPADTSGDLTGYRLFFNNDSGTQLDVATTTAERTGLTPATGYPIRITTLDSSGNESAGISVTGATLLNNPAILTTEAQESRVGLTWNTATPSNLVKQIAVYAETSNFTSIAGLTPRLRLAPGATNATVTGLTNGTPYYFAVTAINLSDGETPSVTTVSATPQSDQDGPTLGALAYRGSPFTNGATLSESGSLTVAASDPSGISRIEFQLDGSPLATDTNGDDGFSASLSLIDLADGSHTLTVTAYDVLENVTTQSFTFTVSLALPVAPAITSPVSGTVTNQTTLTVSGTSTGQTEVLLQLNGTQVAGPLVLDANHRFQAQVTLTEGTHTLTALAQNRGGASPASSPVSIILDTQVPDGPLGLNAQSLEEGQVLLTWNPSSDERVVSYAIYRATEPFDTINQAQQANTNPVTTNRFTDLPLAEGTFHYRVVALNELDTVSSPSNPASAVADSLRPRALAIRYTPTGQTDIATGRMAAGRVAVEVDVSESLLTPPSSVSHRMAGCRSVST